eukprot:COSAG01_NODE_306_length_19162_cov_14.196611_22_plen_78_part_00
MGGGAAATRAAVALGGPRLHLGPRPIQTEILDIGGLSTLVAVFNWLTEASIFWLRTAQNQKRRVPSASPRQAASIEV